MYYKSTSDNTATKTFKVAVNYAESSQFLRPINNEGSSVFKKGSVIPVKFSMTFEVGNHASTCNTCTISYQEEMLKTSLYYRRYHNWSDYDLLLWFFVLNRSKQCYMDSYLNISSTNIITNLQDSRTKASVIICANKD